MKRILKTISVFSILIFLILFIGSRITKIEIFNNVDIRNIFVIIYLITSLYYYKIDSKEKNNEIQKLKSELKKKLKKKVKR